MTQSGRTLSPKLAVDLPTDCESVLVEVAVPGMAPGKDGKRPTHRIVMRRAQAAVLEANARIVSGRECFQAQRKAYQ